MKVSFILDLAFDKDLGKTQEGLRKNKFSKLLLVVVKSAISYPFSEFLLAKRFPDSYDVGHAKAPSESSAS